MEDDEDMDEVTMFLSKMNIAFAIFLMQNEEVNTFQKLIAQYQDIM